MTLLKKHLARNLDQSWMNGNFDLANNMFVGVDMWYSKAVCTAENLIFTEVFMLFLVFCW